MLTHNDNVPWADSATDSAAVGGLTAFGEEVVRAFTTPPLWRSGQCAP